MKLILRAAMLTALASAMLAADVSYQETITLTGQLNGRTVAQCVLERLVYLKGNQMACELSAPLLPTTQSVLPHSYVIYDLDAGSITTINRDKQTYAVQTFDEMTQDLQLKRQGLGRSTDLQFDAKVIKTGRTKQIDGETATESVITLAANDPAVGHQIVVTVHTWQLPMNPSRQEVREFQKRLGEKVPSVVSSAPIASSLSSRNLDTTIFKEMSRMDGYPVLTESWLGANNPKATPNDGANAEPKPPPLTAEFAVHNFVQGVVDQSKFAVPAGYTLVKYSLL